MHGHVPKDKEVTWPYGVGGQRGLGKCEMLESLCLLWPPFLWQTGFYADLLLPRSQCKNSTS